MALAASRMSPNYGLCSGKWGDPAFPFEDKDLNDNQTVFDLEANGRFSLALDGHGV